MRKNLPLQRLLLFPDRYAPSFSRKLFSSFTDHSSFDSSSTGSTAIDGKPLDTLSSISKMEKYSVPPCSTTDTLHKNRRGCPVSDHVTVIVQRVYSASYTIRTLRVLSASAAASYTVLHCHCSHASRAQGSAACSAALQRDTKTHVTGASSL